jgi:hypothetical protein
MDNDKIKKIVDKFLQWRLPYDFSPDAGVKLDRTYTDKWGMPTGTNLLSASQAEVMIRHILEE